MFMFTHTDIHQFLHQNKRHFVVQTMRAVALLILDFDCMVHINHLLM